MTGQAFWISIYFGIALLVALALVFGIGVALHAGTRIQKEQLPLLFLAILVATMAPALTMGRVLTEGLATNEAELDQIASSYWVTRIITLGTLALCAERILRFIVRREWSRVHGWWLFWAFVVFDLSHQILNAIFGSHSAFDHKWLYPFLVYFCLFLVAQNQPERSIRFVRGSLLFFFSCSALAALVIPDAAIQSGYVDGLAIFPFRYYGLASHANTLGPLAIVFMICLWRFPFNSRWINLGSWFLVSTSLILSQSKTSIFIAIVILIFLALYRYRIRLVESGHGRSNLFITVAAGLCMFLAVVGLGTWLGYDALFNAVNQFDLANRGSLTSLTGRTEIWGHAWQEFLANPWFGYGPTIWSAEYRINVGLLAATSAHNQLLHSLSSAGLTGMAALIFYITILIIYALRAARKSGGISIALVGLMLLRSFTEAPFLVSGIMQQEFFVHLVAMVVCVGFQPERQGVEKGKIVRSRVSGMISREYAA